MQEFTTEAEDAIASAAEKHGVARSTVSTLLSGLAASGGNQVQFNIPELGGMGQWSRGGMIMIGDMFNHALKARVDALCNELAKVVDHGQVTATRPTSGGENGDDKGGSHFGSARKGSGNWWPDELGSPSSSGSQNDSRYAFFPGSRRLALEESGELTIYDTGDLRITGVSQQQSGSRSLTFTGPDGKIDVGELKIVSDSGKKPSGDRKEAAAKSDDAGSKPSEEDVIGRIERLADLYKRDIISEDEFQAKKAELLKRV